VSAGAAEARLFFFTVTVTVAEGVLLAAASRAMAAMVCEPLLAEVVFQEIE